MKPCNIVMKLIVTIVRIVRRIYSLPCCCVIKIVVGMISSRGVASLQPMGGHKQQTYYDPANIIIFELTTKS